MANIRKVGFQKPTPIQVCLQFWWLFNWSLKEKWKLHLSICCFMLVPGVANYTPRNWSYWYSTDWYWEDISILNAWIHSLDFTTNVRTAHRSDLFSCAYFPLHLPPSAPNSWDYFLVMKKKIMYWKKNYESGRMSTKFVTIYSINSSVYRGSLEQYENVQCQGWWTLPIRIYQHSKYALLQI